MIVDNDDTIIEVHCTYDPDSAGGQRLDGRRVQWPLHWVSAPHAVDTTVHLYDRDTPPHNATSNANPTKPESKETLVSQGRTGARHTGSPVVHLNGSAISH